MAFCRFSAADCRHIEWILSGAQAFSRPIKRHKGPRLDSHLARREPGSNRAVERSLSECRFFL